ncbi:uncharacterized protein BX663DRAFT_523663 [Cokeromyces recurvatus]|uniref:uncharacterized protein n=1 Tax=Cokeromyces recurvatus TaxID=90255 RepID=UPI00222049EF|nr:uncharacterized protein BX663DRAFT_523663 [Cokeromyces recurvatus]KAI7898842.1 hypothetical protein BX663DRAFT_523663 [Cokeromyces recurvatus]
MSNSELLDLKDKKKTVENLISHKSIEKENKDIFPMPTLSNKNTPGQSDILSRVRAFLPQLKAANEELDKVEPSKRDIENVDEENEQYIEMNLGLGVYDLKKPGQDSDTCSSSDSEDEKIIIPGKLTDKSSKKPIIEILEEKREKK